MADRDIERETMIRLDTLNSVVKSNWENKSKEEKQEFISKLVESINITQDSNKVLHLEKINFRKIFVDMLAKLLDKGIFEVMIPCEINGKEDVILGTPNISDKQVQDYLDRLNEYYETKLYLLYEENDGNGEFIPKKDEQVIKILPISSQSSTTKSPIDKEDNYIQYGIVTYNPNKTKARVLNGECDYATS